MQWDVLLSRRQILASLPLLSGARLLRAQDTQKPSFSTDVKVVNLFATVRDKKDHIVKNLTKDDFVLEEEGKPQTIRYFSQESNLPLTVGLLVDTSGSTRRVLSDERDASEKFLWQVLRPEQDRAFVIHFDFEVELLQDLTGSREKLDHAIGELETAQRQQNQQGGNNPNGGGSSGGGYPGGGYPGGGYPGGGYPGGIGFPRRRGGYPGGGRRPGGGGGQGRGMGGGGTKLYDAVYLGADEIMRKQQGRKALIILSDGEDQGSKESLSTAIETAQRADTLVYTVLFTDSSGSPFGGFGRRGGAGRPDGKSVMQRFARETGARSFEVGKKMPVDQVFAAIEEDLRNLYSIGYTSDNAAGGYRHVRLATRQKGLAVQTREGYYAS